ncbi:MAG: hypothetical protein ACI8XC_003335 [Gammaproteobacteria bacterium]|jgi:hypothetical protein
MTKDQQTEIEAAAFRGLIAHLQSRTDVQNIDLMNLAGFCRNCLAKWYSAEAKNQGLEFDYNKGQEAVYGMSIDQWKSSFQARASEEQMAQFETGKDKHAKITGY